MQLEAIPIESFVKKNLYHPSIQQITERWRIDIELIIPIVVKEIKEMGILFVNKNQTNYIINTMIAILKNSPEIINLIKKSEKEELLKKRRSFDNM